MAYKSSYRRPLILMTSFILILSTEIEFGCCTLRAMKMSWLDANLNCEGLCHYFMDEDFVVRPPPGTGPPTGPLPPPSPISITPPAIQTDDPKRCAYFSFGSLGFNATAVSTKHCRAIFSITEYVPPNCDGFNRQPLSDALCSRNAWKDKSQPQPDPTKLYRVTLAYRFKSVLTIDADPPRLTAYSCDPARYYHKVYTVGTACYPLEYIAISFSGDPTAPFEKNPYYVCLLGEARVEGWKDNGNPAWMTGKTRVSLSSPYVNTAPGVFWSTIMKREGEDVMLCSFILDGKKQRYTPTFWDGRRHHVTLGALKEVFAFEEFGTGTGIGSGWTVKMSFGRVEREMIPYGGMLSNVKKVPTHDQTKMVLSSKKITENLIAVATRRPNLQGTTRRPPDQSVLNEIAKVYKKCRENKALCYFYEDEASCLHREKCHALAAITDESGGKFDTLKISLVSHHKEIPGVIIPTSPFGWVAVGFSDDRAMGMEVAFSCGFMGHGNLRVFLTLNGLNYLNAPVFDSMITPANFLKNVVTIESESGIETEPKVMCSFDIPTKFSVSLFPHYLLWATQDKTSLNYDLKKNSYFVLLASGASVTSTFNLTYHGKGRGQIIKEKFSKQQYNKIVNGVLPLWPESLLILLLILVVKLVE